MDGYTSETHPAKKFFPIDEYQREPNIVLYVISKLSPLVGRIVKKSLDDSSKDFYYIIN